MAAALVPRIPEDAPFTSAQRAWLNGYVAGLFSHAPADAAPSLRVALLYGSQTGTAEGLARKLAKELKSAGHESILASLEGYVPATLAAEKYAVFIVSTYGEGEAPDSAQSFYQQLCVEHFPLLGELSYAVMALGDSHYEHFCRFGKELDAKLSALGGTRIMDRVDCDTDVDAPYAAWKRTLGIKLHALTSLQDEPRPAEAPVGATVTPQDTVQAHSRDNPYLSRLHEKRALTHPSSSKLTLHLNFAIEGSHIHYEAGDACGVLPQNSPELVDSVLSLLPFTGEEAVEIATGSVTLRDALLHHLGVTRLTRRTLTSYAAMGRCEQLSTLLKPERQAELDEYLNGRDLVDLLSMCPGVLQSPSDLVKLLPRLAPRLYSISSSPAAHSGHIHTTVSVVRYHAHNRDRNGVCSTLFADRVKVGERLPLYIQPNKKFRLPRNPDAPVIMIGPGTGVAPFRGFLHERRATGATGRNWLFFGARSAATDFLYREELEAMRADGHLTRLDTAFSRDQQQKIYVQDLMRQNASQLWRWLDDGAHLYVCGDGAHMAKDVNRTLQAIIAQEGGMNESAAESWVQSLKEGHRYQRDVY
ncbi:MAG TPA: sulfite reductase subunit alpha [Terracidiphilus sp.]|nr:sulfite reductase subunit alpha [Terracidiphilus sp.]